MSCILHFMSTILSLLQSHLFNINFCVPPLARENITWFLPWMTASIYGDSNTNGGEG